MDLENSIIPCSDWLLLDLNAFHTNFYRSVDSIIRLETQTQWLKTCNNIFVGSSQAPKVTLIATWR